MNFQYLSFLLVLWPTVPFFAIRHYYSDRIAFLAVAFGSLFLAGVLMPLFTLLSPSLSPSLVGGLLALLAAGAPVTGILGVIVTFHERHSNRSMMLLIFGLICCLWPIGAIFLYYPASRIAF